LISGDLIFAKKHNNKKSGKILRKRDIWNPKMPIGMKSQINSMEMPKQVRHDNSISKSLKIVILNSFQNLYRHFGVEKLIAKRRKRNSHLFNFKLKAFFFLSLLLFCSVNSSYAINNISRELHTDEVIILSHDPSEKIAKEVAEIYPSVRAEIESTIGWEVEFRPVVIILNDRETLEKMTSSSLITALAIPERHLIIIDSSRVYTKPFTLRTTIKHELCHLLLHWHIKKENLPRWLDEGVCQWVSDGLAEIMMDNKVDVLTRAVMSNRLINIRDLKRFPNDDKALLLSYEQSKSLVEYIVEEFGKSGLLKLLESLKEGDEPEDAVWKSFSVTTSELEKKWHAYLKGKHTIFYYFSQNIYIILFLLAALATLYGFIMMRRKKKAYVDEEVEDVQGENKFD
jgi:hypothetical protein